MDDKELMDFVKWLPNNSELFKNLSIEETIAQINNLSSSEEGKEALKQLTNIFKNKEMKLFKDGGKINYLLCLKKGGKGPDCGCNKVTKAAEGEVIANIDDGYDDGFKRISGSWYTPYGYIVPNNSSDNSPDNRTDYQVTHNYIPSKYVKRIPKHMAIPGGPSVQVGYEYMNTYTGSPIKKEDVVDGGLHTTLYTRPPQHSSDSVVVTNTGAALTSPYAPYDGGDWLGLNPEQATKNEWKYLINKINRNKK